MVPSTGQTDLWSQTALWATKKKKKKRNKENKEKEKEQKKTHTQHGQPTTTPPHHHHHRRRTVILHVGRRGRIVIGETIQQTSRGHFQPFVFLGTPGCFSSFAGTTSLQTGPENNMSKEKTTWPPKLINIVRNT